MFTVFPHGVLMFTGSASKAVCALEGETAHTLKVDPTRCNNFHIDSAQRWFIVDPRAQVLENMLTARQRIRSDAGRIQNVKQDQEHSL
jgi:hypothetical protein